MSKHTLLYAFLVTAKDTRVNMIVFGASATSINSLPCIISSMFQGPLPPLSPSPWPLSRPDGGIGGNPDVG